MEEKQTTPKGYKIPVPKREDFEEMLRKSVKPQKGSTPDRPKK